MSSQPSSWTMQRSKSFPEILPAYTVQDEIDAKVCVIKLLTVMLRHYKGLLIDVLYDFKLQKKFLFLARLIVQMCSLRNAYEKSLS